MENFIYKNPTEIIFGENVTDGVGAAVKAYGKKVLLVSGSSSAKTSGLYDKILEQLKKEKVAVIDHCGVSANPMLSHTREGVKKALETKVDVVLALGGGSVIDESKAIAISAAHKDADVWDFMCGKLTPQKCLPIIVVQTFPATGSEMNCGFVITNDVTREKFGCYGGLDAYPKVSFLEPKYTLTIHLKQTAYACSDMMSHLLEGYLSCTQQVPNVTDFYVEGILKSIIASTRAIMKNPSDLDARGSFMWASTLAWNGLGRLGLSNAGTPSHALEHPLSGLYSIAHGAGLSMVKPAWLEYMSVNIAPRILMFGKNVLGIRTKDAGEVIDALIKFYREIGTPTTWAEAGIKKPNYKLLASEAYKLFSAWGMDTKKIYTKADLENIYRLI